MENKSVILGIRRYSEELKQQVCIEYLEKKHTVTELARKYNLSTHTVIYDWLRKYKHLPPKNKYIQANIIEVGLSNYQFTDNFIAKEIISQKQVIVDNGLLANSGEQSEISKLKKQLVDTQIQLEGYKRMIEIAENELKIPIRKKYNTK